MKKQIKKVLIKTLRAIARNKLIRKFIPNESLSQVIFDRNMLRFMPNENLINKSMVLSNDPIRYTMIALAINRIHKENLQGSFAEVGVYRGNTSKVIHYYAPEKTLPVRYFRWLSIYR